MSYKYHTIITPSDATMLITVNPVYAAERQAEKHIGIVWKNSAMIESKTVF